MLGPTARSAAVPVGRATGSLPNPGDPSLSEFSETEVHPIFPVFLLADVSYSMAGEPIEAMNAALPDLKRVIVDDPTIGEMARIGIITFSDDARPILPLCDLEHADIPRLAPESGTNFAAAFRVARQEIEREISGLGRGTRFYRPVVFFMSDGDHVAREDWSSPLRELTDRQWKFNPEVVTFGFGDAKPESLGKIATRYAFMASVGTPANQVREIISTLIASIRTTSSSLRSGDQGGLVVEPDKNKFTPLPILEV
jgi:uncharacterized protein YegL